MKTNIRLSFLCAWLISNSAKVLCLENVTDIDGTLDLPLCSNLADTNGSFEVPYGYGSRTCKWARRTCTDEVCMMEEVSLNCPITCGVNCLTGSGNIVRAEPNEAPVPEGQLKRQTTNIILWSLSIAGFVVTLAILLRRKQVKTRVVRKGHHDHERNGNEKPILSSDEILHIWNNKTVKIDTQQEQPSSLVQKDIPSSSINDKNTILSRFRKVICLPRVTKHAPSAENSCHLEIQSCVEDSEDDTDPCEITMMESIDLEDASTGEGEQEIILHRSMSF